MRRQSAPNTAILPLLNGMRHMDLLGARFGAGAVLGGQCVISATLDADGRILHLNDLHFLSFGEQNGAKSPRVAAIAAALSGAKFDSAALHRDPPRDVGEMGFHRGRGRYQLPDARRLRRHCRRRWRANSASDMFAECCAIAAKNGFAPGETAVKRSIGMLTAAGSPIAASMLRDIERGARIEADHIVGDLLQRGGGSAERLSAVANRLCPFADL